MYIRILGSGTDWFFSDPDFLGPKHLDPTTYFKIFKYLRLKKIKNI